MTLDNKAIFRSKGGSVSSRSPPTPDVTFLMASVEQALRTPLHQLHLDYGGRLVSFAGWELPVQYEGVIAEHVWGRTGAVLFDVSHMGIVDLHPSPPPAATADGTVAEQLERLTPAAITTLPTGRGRYALLTNDDGGVIDDCIVTNRGDYLTVVVNASRRAVDLAHLRASLPSVEVTERADLALLALQGPEAALVLRRLAPDVDGMVFGDFAELDLHLGTDSTIPGVGVSRSGYTGEDGFEIMVVDDHADRLARALLASPEVKPAGLGARDTLRLEAGLALYGQDLDESTSPIEADLAWTVPKRRRADAGFLGADRILRELEHGPSRRRVGLRPSGRRPVRQGATLRTTDGEEAGTVTSGGYGPTVGGPVAMGYVPAGLHDVGRVLVADVRGSEVELVVSELPFSPHRYHRGT